MRYTPRFLREVEENAACAASSPPPATSWRELLTNPAPRHAAVLGGGRLSTAIRSPIAASRVGRGQDLFTLRAAYYAAFAPLANGLSEFECEPAPSRWSTWA